MQKQFPKSHQFSALAHQLLSIKDAIEWPLIPNRDSGEVATSVNALLVGARLGFVQDRHALPETARSAFGLALRENAAGQWLDRNPDYRDMRLGLQRQAKRRGNLFAQADAPISLAIATTMALSLWAAHTESGQIPSVPTKRDWRDALSAVDQLRSLQSKGVSLSAAVKVSEWRTMPYDWLDQLSAAIQAAAKSAPKAHRDAALVERQATKAFAHWCWLLFGEVPPVLVVKFGRSIDYESALLERQHLPEWIEKFRTHSIY